MRSASQKRNESWRSVYSSNVVACAADVFSAKHSVILYRWKEKYLKLYWGNKGANELLYTHFFAPAILYSRFFGFPAPDLSLERKAGMRGM